MQHQQPEREKVVFRTVPIPVSAFDHIKDTQRATQARTRQAVTFNEVFALIAHEHKQHTQNADNAAHAHDQTQRTRTAIVFR
ncbi:MAG: hypothetical protein HY836_12880 [Aquabacterium sp.]|uniref:hypothetical protein n=1 Tax=Aquabacterium sp. TaxID=1872578 RepID=UPI0025C1BFE3|nr:hypothetical protein [Aquabacterium sp.]MBI5926477.1 hypothetical protein [Aquabacterium sp.]